MKIGSPKDAQGNTITTLVVTGSAGSDVYAFVSGTIGLSGSTAKKTVFGGDVVVSGSITTTMGLNGWVAIDIDFAAQSSQTLGSDTTYTIVGKTWTKVNSANDAAAMAIVSGSGLVITPASSTDLGNNVNTLPLIKVPISSIIPGFDLSMPIRISMYVTSSNETANYDSTDMGLMQGSFAFVYSVGRGYGYPTGGSVNHGLQVNNGISRVQFISVTTNTSYRVEQLNLPMGVSSYLANSFAANFSSSMPMQSSFYQTGLWAPSSYLGAGGAVGASPPSGTSTDWSLFFGGHRAGSGTPYVTTIKQVRIEYRP